MKKDPDVDTRLDAFITECLANIQVQLDDLNKQRTKVQADREKVELQRKDLEAQALALDEKIRLQLEYRNSVNLLKDQKSKILQTG